MKKNLLAGLLAITLAAVAGIYSTRVLAQPAQPTFSIAVHFEYADGFSYDIVLAREVPASEKSSMLAECGKSHRTGSVVRYHCYAIPE